MAKVTVSIEGTSEEVVEYLQKLVSGKGQNLVGGVSWLPEEIESFYDNLKPEAQRILKEVAKNPTGYDRDDLINRLGLDVRKIPGNLSSVEFKRKKLFPSKPKAMWLDWDIWKYKMLPEVAEWIINNRT